MDLILLNSTSSFSASIYLYILKAHGSIFVFVYIYIYIYKCHSQTATTKNRYRSAQGAGAVELKKTWILWRMGSHGRMETSGNRITYIPHPRSIALSNHGTIPFSGSLEPGIPRVFFKSKHLQIHLLPTIPKKIPT